MATQTPPAVTADTPITIKVNYNGVSKRFKLPLRDLGAATLENKLRGELRISPGTETLIQRYSDSASAYVVIDASNVAVYKQLYRAAKAKQKLKFRVTTKEKAVEEEDTGPRPASVEDEKESEVQPPQLISIDEADKSVTSPLPAPAQHAPIQLCSRWQAVSGQSARLCMSLASVQREQMMMERTLEKLEASVAALSYHSKTLMDSTQKFPDGSPPSLAVSAESQASEPTEPHLSTFAVCCNSCDKNNLDAHYHCSTCDEGDFDLCQTCVEQGITCYGLDHWLIKRVIRNGAIVNSTTERIAPKPKSKVAQEEPVPAAPAVPSTVIPSRERIVPIPIPNSLLEPDSRTCNCCVNDFPERAFVHCTTCEDFDLCKACFIKNEHGHHPKHAFVAAAEPSQLEPEVTRLLTPGRAQIHNAICDECNRTIEGVRHKCLDCPDFDYCSRCVQYSRTTHPNHRFVPIYEPIETVRNLHIRAACRPIHVGICCDGPLCSSNHGAYIVGDRYKCAVCHDTDFCANCEASPVNTHNRTHPLIKFKTPVRRVSVTTTGDQHNGEQLPIMGDHPRPRPTGTSSRATETTNQGSVATDVQTVVNVQPSEPATPVKVEEEDVELKDIQEKPKDEKSVTQEDLVAVFKRDTIPDGMVMSPNCVFEQTWVLRNEGTTAWPAGCSVKFVRGDYMGHVDPNHPAAISELVSSSESTICYTPVAPGQEFPFTVLLRTPQREGRVVSNWRLTTKDGMKFGHRLWCDVIVQKPVSTEDKGALQDVKVEENVKEEVKDEASSAETHESQMIFPKLEKESPVSSIHEASKAEPEPASEAEEEYEECDEDDEWAEDESEEGFLTDEEYDILDASDEEYLEDQQKQLLKK